MTTAKHENNNYTRWAKRAEHAVMTLLHGPTRRTAA